MTVIDKEGEICDMDKKETFGGEIAKQLPVKDIYNVGGKSPRLPYLRIVSPITLYQDVGQSTSPNL